MIDIPNLPTVPDADIRDTSQLVLQTTDSNGVTYTGSVTVDQMFNAGGTGCGCVYTAKLDIPSAQVLTLNTTPVAFGLTVPTGYYARPLSADLKAIYNSLKYVTNTNIWIRSVGATDPILKITSGLNFSFDTFTRFDMQDGAANDASFIDHADLEIYVPTGNPTAGDSDITIYITYMLIEL